MLDMSLADIHAQSKFWLSEVDLWNIELLFFRKLINKGLFEVDDEQDKSELDHYIELMDYYQVRLLKEARKRLIEHEESLKRLVDGNEWQDEESFREEHKGISLIVETFENEFRNLKKEFLTYIETIIKD